MSTKTKAKKTAKKKLSLKIGHIYIKPISKKKFDAMTPARKRVALAKDVLLRLEMGKIKEKHGTYLSPVKKGMDEKIRDGRSYMPENPANVALAEMDAKTFVNENLCEVCAKGSIILSWAANFNELKLKRVLDASFLDQLEYIFPEGMWDSMESAFENDPLLRWSLKQVMSWLIKHKGNFPYDGYLYTDENTWGKEVGEKIAPVSPPKEFK